MHMVPIHPPGGFRSTGVIASMTPWMTPGFMALNGTTANGDPGVAISFETPVQWLRGERAPKLDHEILLLRRFSTDQALATGGIHAFSDIREGQDPPDAVAVTSEGDLGVESTVLSVPGRRAAHALFGQVRRQLAATTPPAFARLAGWMVYIWFDEPDGTGHRPPRANDHDAARELVEALAAYEPSPEQMMVSHLPQEQAPMPPLSSTSSGARFYAVPMQQAAPTSVLFSMLGFEIGLAYTTVLSAQEAWAEVQRLVDQHDQDGVDLLLISAGAPDRDGVIYPGEEAMAQLLLEHPLGLARSPQHIASVVLHQWSTGTASALYPSIQGRFGPLFQSHVQGHQPLLPPDAEPDESEQNAE